MEDPLKPSPNITAVALDAAGIQTYVFGSNRLKENVGGSYLIAEELFGRLLIECLTDIVGDPAHLADDWTHTASFKMAEHPEYTAEIGYIGGGNALLFFRHQTEAHQFLRYYSQAVLLHFPGLRVVSGIVENVSFEEVGQDFPGFRRRYEAALTRNKHGGHNALLIPKPGIADDCPLSNEAAAERFAEHGQKPQWIGAGAKRRLDAADDSQRELLRQYPEAINQRFTFSLELEHLGQGDEKGYVAIVHIDGNGIGKLFKSCESLSALRTLSIEVADAAESAMTRLIEELALKLQPGTELWEILHLHRDESGKITLPIRPMIVGGDDVVFVCEGKLGVHLAERYVHHFRVAMQPIATQHQIAINACAGVAIVKTKYPFYRAYLLAEGLMRKAKQAAHAHQQTSWLAFLVASSGFNGELDEILEQQYRFGDLDLYGGPYQLDGDPKPLSELKKDVLHLQTWPRNKVMELREMLTQPRDVQGYFLDSLRSRQLLLPGQDPATLKQTGSIPPLREADYGRYLDMIDLMEFYPKDLLQCN
jgi:hypothetical protein